MKIITESPGKGSYGQKHKTLAGGESRHVKSPRKRKTGDVDVDDDDDNGYQYRQGQSTIKVPLLNDDIDEEFNTELFQDLNDALRSYMFSTAQSIDKVDDFDETMLSTTENNSGLPTKVESEQDRRDNETVISGITPQSSEIARFLKEDPGKVALLENYITEVAPWLDMFDRKSHFGVSIPSLAQSSPVLMYSILAISSRQVERRGKELSSISESTTLELYQLALHNLLPAFDSIETRTVAACVILCVLEMMSSSPANWRKHLEGCASLFSAAGIHGFCEDPLARALFWCYARMDLSCSVIEHEPPIIACKNWLPPPPASEPHNNLGNSPNLLFTGSSSIPLPPKAVAYEMYANYAVFLSARVSELLVRDNSTYINSDWDTLWDEMVLWEANRPPEMLPVTVLEHTVPFPTILYTNGPAISGNQLFHAASIRMLLSRPKGCDAKPPKSVLWHSRRICGISQTNNHHGCLNNALQPLWIAGRQMSHHTEHKAILELLDRIERDTGWAMRWRGEDLKEYWGIQ